jgi:hypothetical protein
MPDDFVKKQDNRGSVGLGYIEGMDRHGKHILMVGGGKGYNRVIPMGSPPGLVDISLTDMGRIPR